MKELFLGLLDHHVIAALVLMMIIGIRFLLIKFPVRIRFYLWLIPTWMLLCPISLNSDYGLIEMPDNLASYPLGKLKNNSQSVPILAGRGNEATDWLEILAWLWIIVAAIILVISIIQFVNIRLKTRDKVMVHSDVYISDYAESAFVIGLWLTKIILPSNLDEKEKHYILLHEKSHIQRKDHLIRLAGWLCVCVYWFDPLVWIYYRLLVLDMEIACDERVLMKLNENERLDYSQCLLNQSGRVRSRYLVTGFKSSDLKKRIQKVVLFKKSRVFVNVIAVMVVLLSGIMLITRPNTIERNNTQLVRGILNQSSEELFLNDVINFGWDEMFVFNPKSIFSVTELENVLGIENSFQKEKDYGYTLLVFINEKEPVAWFNLHPDLSEFIFSFPFENEKVLKYTSNELIKLSKTEEYGTVIWKPSGIAYTLAGLDKNEQQLVLMFDEAIREIYELDAGLNHDIEYIVMDMDNLNVLSDQGKSVLLGMVQEYTKVKTITRSDAEK